MFDFLFGWRKASKCKKLLKRVRCRLKLLKNKRSIIVRQLKEDVAMLLNNGHDQIAFNRVEQLFMDEKMVAVYDLLDQFCDVVMVNLSYIRRRKDCPNDVNEAISSLVYASARFGDLPELPMIRELFKKRYGHRFAATALELLPGNLVNCQIKDSLSIKMVSDDVKYKLMDDIARTCIQPGLLALECSSDMWQQQANKYKDDQILKGGCQKHFKGEDKQQLRVYDCQENQGTIVCVKFSSDGKTHLTEPIPSQSNSDNTARTSDCSSANSHSTMDEKEAKFENVSPLKFPYEFTLSDQNSEKSWSSSRSYSGGMSPELPSDSSVQLTEETIHLDDIKELKSPTTKHRYQDQRLFKFRSTSIVPRCKITGDTWNEKVVSSHRKRREDYITNLRKRSESPERVMDFDCATYYGRSSKNSSKHNQEPRKYWMKHQNKKNKKNRSLEDNHNLFYFQNIRQKHSTLNVGCNWACEACRLNNMMKSPYVCCVEEEEVGYDCSLDSPCNCKDRKSPSTPAGRNARALDASRVQNEKTRTIERSAKLNNSIAYTDYLSNLKNKKLGEYDDVEVHDDSNSGRNISPSTIAELKTTSYSRAVTMPSERSNNGRSKENILRSNSLPLEQSSTDSNNASSSSSHVHPKLPDYDELAATFMALKKANLQKSSTVKPPTILEGQ